MKNLFLFLIVFASFSLPVKSFACSCLLRVTPATNSEKEARLLNEKFIREDFEKTDAVFSGEVLKVTFNAASETEPIGYYEVKFKTERIWKGFKSKEVTVFTPDNCFRYNFSVGESYLVYAGNYDGSNQLWTSICAGTTSLPIAEEKLKVIGKGKKIKGKQKPFIKAKA